MPPKPKITFDLEYLSGLQSVDAPREIFSLDEAGQQILSQLAEMLLWRTRWYSGDVPENDVPDMAYTVYEDMKVPIHLDDLVPYLDDIEPKLDALIASQCCASPASSINGVNVIGTDPAGDPDDTTVGIGPLPQPFLDNPLADYDESGTPDWDDYSIYLCDAGHRLASALGDWLARLQFGQEFDAFSLARQLVSAIVTRLFPGVVDDLWLLLWDELYGWADAIGNALLGAPSGAEWDTIWSDWHGGVRNDVICAVAQAADADSAAADVRDLMQSLYTGLSWDAVWALFPLGRILRKVFEGAQSYEGPYACDCAEPLVAGYNVIEVDWDGTLVQQNGVATLTDLGDGVLKYEGYREDAGGRVNSTFGWEINRDLTGWTVDHVGWFFDLTDTSGNLTNFKVGSAALAVWPLGCHGYWYDAGGGASPTQQDVDPFCADLTFGANGASFDVEIGAGIGAILDTYCADNSLRHITFKLYAIVHLS